MKSSFDVLRSMLDVQCSPSIVPPFYPARPVNGGPLPIALPKSGRWTLEGKYNGWRAWVHNPTGAMFNRELEPLSINGEFAPALHLLRAMPWEWSDVEALERRHNIGRGSLILLDYLPVNPAETYTERKSYLHLCASVIPGGIEIHKGLDKPIANNRVYLPMTWTMDAGLARVGDIVPGVGAPEENWPGLWQILQECNKALGNNGRCGTNGRSSLDFWEGLVAKRNDSIYPRQRRNAGLEFPYWMKHRWAY
jgi:hypothetical protein